MKLEPSMRALLRVFAALCLLLFLPPPAAAEEPAANPEALCVVKPAGAQKPVTAKIIAGTARSMSSRIARLIGIRTDSITVGSWPRSSACSSKANCRSSERSCGGK